MKASNWRVKSKNDQDRCQAEGCTSKACFSIFVLKGKFADGTTEKDSCDKHAKQMEGTGIPYTIPIGSIR